MYLNPRVYYLSCVYFDLGVWGGLLSHVTSNAFVYILNLASSAINIHPLISILSPPFVSNTSPLLFRYPLH